LAFFDALYPEGRRIPARLGNVSQNDATSNGPIGPLLTPSRFRIFRAEEINPGNELGIESFTHDDPTKAIRPPE